MISNQTFCSVSGNLTTSISDHLPQFNTVENFKKLYETNKGKLFFRRFKKFNEKPISKTMKCVDWSLAAKNDTLDLDLERFMIDLIKL